ncbi:molybdenum cofactor guanylyltransferase [Tamlana sp. 2201CG12-4]|uniref:molybdenum cofactor guanylyltransferase n=1 Tax=Tamlana sp. 2201CG12-4 TaxID=3112582 RepID=UPI002DB5F54F|nr:molybdenum cofactor guanylyltransferase [Tamlana sp. 2201CG12-4]MEC3907783.1 molybdenum cofactor guanylyltransferase [Tamlana sp. 2201CG12-4]
MLDKNNITGIILAGGKSSRMGSDKGLIELHGKPFIQYSIEALKPWVTDIIIVSDSPDYDKFGYKRVTDIIKESGPVAGICSGLEASKTNYNLVLSCDIPLINSGILEKLVSQIDNETTIIQVESNGKSMPLIAFYQKACVPKFKALLEQGERRLRIAIKSCKFKNIVLDDNDHITTMNVNTKEELKLIENACNN